ncbi:MAG TPA: hypothetical protein VH599_08495 [Ktedonobacterales bacterium]|jgi:hypothetical protein
MLREESTEPMMQQNTALSLPGAARAAQTIQAQVDAQGTMTTLADQLLVLFDEIPSAGLIRQNRRSMHQYVQTYFRIADGVWEAMATDQLNDLTSNPGYNVVTDALEQKLVEIHEACQRAEQNPQARGGWLWRRRVRLYSRSLLEWKRCMDTSSGAPPDPTACGRVLYRAHGRVGLAGITGFDYLLVMGLPILGMVTSLLLAFLFGAMNVLLPNNLPGSLAPTVLAGLSALFLLWFSTTGSEPLSLIIGYALTRRQSMIFTRTLRSSISVKTDSGPLRVFLRVWLTTLGTLFVIGLLGLLVLIGFVARAFFSDTHAGRTEDVGAYMTSFVQTTLVQPFQMDRVFFTLLFPIICLAMIVVFSLPFTVIVQARMVKALLGQPTRSPEARRYALRPALELLSFHTITLLFVAVLVNSIYNVGASSLLPSGWPFVSARLLVYMGALILPYVFLINLPFSEGMARWRGARLRELALRRNEIAQRLSRSQPQATDQTDLRTLQEYVTWQYYRTQESDVKDVRSMPFPIERLVLALILAILGGIALDWINQLLHSLV